MIKLIHNETIKTLKKTSTKIVIILAILSLFGAMLFSKGIMALKDYAYDNMEDQDWKEQTKAQISQMKNEIANADNNYDKQSIASMKAVIDTYELALENDVNYMHIYNGYYWKNQILNEIGDTKASLSLFNGNEYLTKEQKEQVEEYKTYINDRITLLKNNDYSGYIELNKKELKAKLEKKLITEEEYNDEMYLLNLQDKYEIFKEDGTEYSWKQTIFDDIKVVKESLRTGLSSNTRKLLKLDEVQELEDNLKIYEYRLENEKPVIEFMPSARALFDVFAPSFSMIMVAILMIIVAGSSISGEVSKGTIKFLLFTPNKRWKIVLAKIISAMLILVVLTVILALICTLMGNIFFDEAGTEYIYIRNGEICVISNLNYMVLYSLALAIDLLVYMFFAFMLSVITRNTALSVGVSIACYVGSGIIMNNINYYITADWVKFIPFNNLDIADKIFTNNVSFTTMLAASNVMNNVSIWFSLGVLGVCTAIMLVTVFDSFNKRDIV